MKNVILATLTLLILANVSFAQCSKSGGGYFRPARYHVAPADRRVPAPWPAHVPDEPARCKTPTPKRHPEPVNPERPKVETGQQVTIDGRFFGSRQGEVSVDVGGMSLPAEIVEWSSSQAVAVLPHLPLSRPVPATVVVRTAFGTVVDQLNVELHPSTSRAVGGAESVQPTGRSVVTPGQSLTLEGSDFGFAPGQVRLVVGALALNAQVQNWSNTEATATLPTLNFSEPVSATIQILAANGQVVDQVEVTFAPDSSPVPVAAFAAR